MPNLKKHNEFVKFCHGVIENELEHNMTIVVDDIDNFKEVSLASFDEIFSSQASTQNLDLLREGKLVTYLLGISGELLESNLDNTNFELIETESNTLLEDIRDSLIIAGTGDVSELLRGKIFEETGKDPLNEPWYLEN